MVAAVTVLGTSDGARADASAGSPPSAAAASPGAGPTALQRAKIRFMRMQRDVNRALSDGIVAIRNGQSSYAILLAMLVAFSYGVLHAVGPGHGKAVVVGYFLSRDGSILRGIRMGAQIALLHVISAVVIVVFARWLLDITFAGPVDQLQALKLFSYGAITVIGGLMLAGALRSLLHPKATATGVHDCHHHRIGGERGLLSLAVGLIPCSGAVLVLIYALANDLLLSGLVMTACIAVGMAATLSAIGIATVWTRARLVGGGRASSPARRITRASLDVLGPLFIFILGAVLWLTALG
jgi:ABC-type nickel/cobalt efflux system permease component RcnA